MNAGCINGCQVSQTRAKLSAVQASAQIHWLLPAWLMMLPRTTLKLFQIDAAGARPEADKQTAELLLSGCNHISKVLYPFCTIATWPTCQHVDNTIPFITGKWPLHQGTKAMISRLVTIIQLPEHLEYVYRGLARKHLHPVKKPQDIP